MSEPIVEGLRLINRKLGIVLARWEAETMDAASILPQVLTDVLTELHNAARWLGMITPGSVPGPELEKEIAEYRSNAGKMEQVLPRVQGRLLAEKARLEGARSHVEAAAAWAEGRRTIF
jgi:hypothetical protein